MAVNVRNAMMSATDVTAVTVMTSRIGVTYAIAVTCSFCDFCGCYD